MEATTQPTPEIRWCTEAEITALLQEPVGCRNLFGQPGLLTDLLNLMRRYPGDRRWYLPARVTAAGEWVAAGGFKGPPREQTVEIGYRVHPQHRRQGYASALTRWLCHVAATEGLRRVVAVTASSNLASQGVLAQNGFVHSGDFLSDSQQWLQRWQYKVPEHFHTPRP